MYSSTAYPLARPTRARPTAVLPEDESAMTLPGVRAPLFSPSVTRDRAVRSLTEPPGLNHSHLPQTSAPGGSPASPSLRRGVFPIPSRLDSSTGTAVTTRPPQRPPGPPAP